MHSYVLCGAVALPVHMSSNVEYFAGSHAYLLRPHVDKLVNGIVSFNVELRSWSRSVPCTSFIFLTVKIVT